MTAAFAIYRWYDLGPYRILARPLPTNEYWTTHRIYHGGKYLGAQLSVPSIEDCKQIEFWREKPPHSEIWAMSERDLDRAKRGQAHSGRTQQLKALEAA